MHAPSSDGRKKLIFPILPPLALGYFLAAALFLQRIKPLFFAEKKLFLGCGMSLVLFSVGLALASIHVMRQNRVSPNLFRRTKFLIETGPFRWSRNPIYLAIILFYLGVGAILDNLWFALLCPLLILTLDFGVIRREEIYLEEKFGAAYHEYKRRVRRWI